MYIICLSSIYLLLLNKWFLYQWFIHFVFQLIMSKILSFYRVFSRFILIILWSFFLRACIFTDFSADTAEDFKLTLNWWYTFIRENSMLYFVFVIPILLSGKEMDIAK